MRKRPFRLFGDLDGRVQVTIVGVGVQNWAQQLTMQYTQLYATDLGADAVNVGLLNSIAAAVGSVASVPLGWVAENISVRSVLLIGLACIAMSAAISALAGSWLMLIPAFIIGARLVRIKPLADIIFITASQPQHRATVMALSRAFWGTLNVFAPISAALIVSGFGGIGARGIRPLYYIQFALTMLVLLFMARKLQPLPRHARRTKDRPSLALNTFIKDMRQLFEGETWLGRWVVLRVIRQFGTSLAVPFAVLWMVNVKGANPQILGIMGTVSVVSSLVLQVPAGRLTDKIGRKRAYLLLRPVAYLGTLLLVLAPRPQYLVLAGLLGTTAMMGGDAGGIGNVSHIPFITMFWEAVPEEKRGRWFGVEGLVGLVTIPASILGGVLWEHGLQTQVLLLPILLEILLVTPILFTIPDTLHRSSSEPG